MSTPESDSSGYTLISDTQERYSIFDIYMTCTIGATLSVLMLSTLTSLLNHANTNRQSINTTYYRYAIICGIFSSLSALLFYLFRFVSTDLILPTNFLMNDVNIASLWDAFMMLNWTMEKIAFYYGFSYLYLSLTNKNSMDVLLKIMLILFVIAIMINSICYFTNDLMTSELTEISHGEKRGIYAVLLANANLPLYVLIVCMIGLLIDVFIVILLIYRFNLNKNRKGIVLLSISSLTWVIWWIAHSMDSDIKFVIDSLPTVIDTICLFLMFDENQGLYNNFCGCLFCGVGSKYESIQETDDDDINYDL